MSPYEMFEHTADVGLRVTAGDLNGLFAEAGRGFFWLIVENLDEVRAVQEVTVELEVSDLEALFLDWLSELLFRFETEYIVLKDFEVNIDGTRLRATARGEPLDTERHEVHLNIKAVTYHGLRVEQTEDGWVAEVIFDI
jgi:SHS2 domain-containing protein